MSEESYQIQMFEAIGEMNMNMASMIRSIEKQTAVLEQGIENDKRMEQTLLEIKDSINSLNSNREILDKIDALQDDTLKTVIGQKHETNILGMTNRNALMLKIAGIIAAVAGAGGAGYFGGNCTGGNQQPVNIQPPPPNYGYTTPATPDGLTIPDME